MRLDQQGRTNVLKMRKMVLNELGNSDLKQSTYKDFD